MLFCGTAEQQSALMQQECSRGMFASLARSQNECSAGSPQGPPPLAGSFPSVSPSKQFFQKYTQTMTH